MGVIPGDVNDNVVYGGKDVYLPNDSSLTIFDDSRLFIWGEVYLNGQPILTGSGTTSGTEVAVGPSQPVDPGVVLWFDSDDGTWGTLKVKVGGSWQNVQDPQAFINADEAIVTATPPAAQNYELWFDTTVDGYGELKVRQGGTWKPVINPALANNEVFIGTDEPQLSGYEVWFDTDEQPPADTRIAPGNPLGIVAVGSFVGSSITIPASTAQDLTNGLPFKTLANRRYRIIFFSRAVGATGTGFCAEFFQDSTLIGSDWVWISGSYTNAHIQTVFNGDGATHTYKVRASGANTVSVNMFGDSTCFFYIEDVGPTSLPALPILEVPSAVVPLGVVGMGLLVSGDPIVLSPSTLTKMTNDINITTYVGRRYEIIFSVRTVNSTTATPQNIQIDLRDGTTLYLGVGGPNKTAPANTAYDFIHLKWLLDGDGLSHAFNVAFTIGSVAVNAYTKTQGYFYIKDVGSNAYPAIPAPAAPPPWTPITFQNNWNNGAGVQACGYRKIGDIVYLRGRAQAPGSGSVANTVITTLPAGFRPPGILEFSSTLYNNTAWVAARLFIDTNGLITFTDPSNAPLGGLLALSIPPFSTTA